jgi:hypothetical protein
MCWSSCYFPLIQGEGYSAGANAGGIRGFEHADKLDNVDNRRGLGARAHGAARCHHYTLDRAVRLPRLEALMCSLICFGIVGILGFTGAVPTVLLWVAGVCGTLGTLLAGTGAISAVLARPRYGI